MTPSRADPSTQRILVVQPTWVGDAVMATPALRAIRNLYPQAHISYLLKRYVKPMYTGMPWADQLITYRSGKTNKKAGKAEFVGLAARLRKGKFDTAILLPGSFKSALVCKLAGIKRIIGYDRDGRGFLLTDKLLPQREGGRYVPTPIIKYYLGLAHYLGSRERDLTMQLFVTPSEQREAERVLERAGVDPARRPLVMLNPGAQYGSSKCWPAEYFATVADRLVDELGAQVLISSAPKERKIVDEITRHMSHVPIDLAKAGLTLGALKEIVRRCDLMISNDTGPRHMAAAFGVPVVAIFGPTHPEWTEIYYAKERIVSVPVHCGPCQLKVCPIDHRCMTRVTPAMVWDTALRLLPREGSRMKTQETNK
jgi:heptosyltransferase II